MREADLYNQEELQFVGQLAVYSDGTTLKDHVSAECYQKTIETAVLIGRPESTAAYLKPWYLFLLFDNVATAGNNESEQINASLGS